MRLNTFRWSFKILKPFQIKDVWILLLQQQLQQLKLKQQQQDKPKDKVAIFQFVCLSSPTQFLPLDHVSTHDDDYDYKSEFASAWILK